MKKECCAYKRTSKLGALFSAEKRPRDIFMDFFNLVKKPSATLISKIQDVYEINDFYATLACFIITIASLDQKSKYYDKLYERMTLEEEYDSCVDIEKFLKKVIPLMRAECGQEYVQGYAAVIKKEMLAYAGAYPYGFAEIPYNKHSVLQVLDNDETFQGFVQICDVLMDHRKHMRNTNDYLIVCRDCGDIPEKVFKQRKNRKNKNEYF